MLTIYNPTRRILIVKNKKGRIIKAFGGAIAAEKFKETVNELFNIRENEFKIIK